MSIIDNINKKKTKLSMIESDLNRINSLKIEAHKKVGAYSNETNQLQTRWAKLKKEERTLISSIEKSEVFLKNKEMKPKRKAKPYKSFSSHLFSKL